MKPLFHAQAAFAALPGVPVERVTQWVSNGIVDSMKPGKTCVAGMAGVSP